MKTWSPEIGVHAPTEIRPEQLTPVRECRAGHKEDEIRNPEKEKPVLGGISQRKLKGVNLRNSIACF